MPMKNPARPGDVVGLMIRELDITVTVAAGMLGVSRQALSNLTKNPNASVTPQMALRLEAVFGSTAGNWLRMQASYDEAMIQKRRSRITKGLRRAETSAELIAAAV